MINTSGNVFLSAQMQATDENKKLKLKNISKI